MNDHYLWLSEHILKGLNNLGIVKDAQVNSTTTKFMASRIDEYMNSQKLELTDKSKS